MRACDQVKYPESVDADASDATNRRRHGGNEILLVSGRRAL
jgi:hypothetical protein